MANTSSIVTTVDGSTWDNFETDDGNIARIRDGQTVVCSAFGNLSIPAGATIDGIEVDLEGRVHVVEEAGGTSELWGMTWNATTAAAIQVRLAWGTSDGDAVYLDYVLVRITYTEAGAVAGKGKIQLTSGKLQLNSGKIIF